MSQRIFYMAGAVAIATLGFSAIEASASYSTEAMSSASADTLLVAQASGGKSKKTKGTKEKSTKAKGKGKRSDSGAASGTTSAPATTTTGKTTTTAKPTVPTAPTPPPPPTPTKSNQVLDLSGAKSDEAARQEVISGQQNSGKSAAEAGGFDFGGGATQGDKASQKNADIDFGDVAIDMGQLNAATAESARFEKALALMSDEKYEKASLEFRYFLEDPKFAEVQPEAQYQLAKALYKMGFIESSLNRFKAIIEVGPTHRRYKKSVEWLFFISRTMADETPVLAELARFRNVNFPKAYRNEYRYLLAKYLFIQANRFEVARVQDEELNRNKKRVEGFDFGAAQSAVDSGSASFDFSSLGGGEDKGNKGGSGFDFGAASGDAMDFGSAPADKKGISGGNGGFDFGSPSAPPEEHGLVRENGPSNAKEAIRQGLELASEVEPDSKFYARAKYLEGLLYYLSGEPGADQKAVNSWQEVVRVLNPRGGARLDPRLREMAFLSLARVHYGYRQFDRAAYYYDQIDRDSENWLTALFEASWAYYRRGDFEKALGNLLTLHSPFFEREYFPESQLVKAIIYFEACRYGETRQIVDDFIERYTVVMKEIEKLAAEGETGQQIYDRIATLQAGGGADDDLTARLVSLALSDPEIRTARDVLTQVNAQQAMLAKMPDEFRNSKLGEEARDDLNKAQVQYAKEAGEVTRKKFERELYALKGLLAQALRVKLEVARAERESVEGRMRGEGGGERIVPAVPRTVVDDEHHYWPYEGEYWRDELGTYELDFSMCRPEGTPVASSGAAGQ